MRISTVEIGEPHELEHVSGKTIPIVAWHAPHLEPECNVFEDRQMWEEAVALEDHAHVALARRHVVHPLLADEDHAVMEKYGVWQELKANGERRVCVTRSTFVIDKKGRVRHVFQGMNPRGHVYDVLDALKLLD